MVKLQPHEKARARPHIHSAETIGHPPGLLSMSFDACEPQLQSFLYGWLPFELRQMIFEIMFSGGALEFYIRPKASTAVRETRVQWHEWTDGSRIFSEREPWEEAGISNCSRERYTAAAALIATCRRVFIDTVNIVFYTNWLYPNNLVSLHKLKRCIPMSSFQAITSLRLCTFQFVWWQDLYRRETSARRALRQCPTLPLYVVRNLPQVKHLELGYGTTKGFGWWIAANERLDHCTGHVPAPFTPLWELLRMRELMKPPLEGTLESYTFWVPLTTMYRANYSRSGTDLGAYVRFRDGREGEYLDTNLVPYSAEYVNKSVLAAKTWLFCTGMGQELG